MARSSIHKYLQPRKRRKANAPGHVKSDSTFYTANQGYGVTTAADRLAFALRIHLDSKYRGRRVLMPKLFAAAVSQLADNRPMTDVDAYEWLLEDYLKSPDVWRFPGFDRAVTEMRRGFKRVRIEIEDRKIAAARRKALLEAQQISGAEFYQSLVWRELRYKVLKKSDGACEACRRSAKDHGVAIHVDHIMPRSEFPDLALEETNLQVLCDDCNIGKGVKDTTDWRGTTSADADPSLG